MGEPMSLRARVAAAAAVAIVVAVALLGVAVSALLGSQLTGALDDSLRSRAVEVARLAAATPAAAHRARRAGGPDHRRRAVRAGRRPPRADRRALGRARRPGAARQPRAARCARHAQRATGFADGELGDAAIRIYAAPLGTLGGGAAAGGAVVVAGTTADIEETLQTRRAGSSRSAR